MSIAQWETQNSGVSADLLDVCFVDSLHGWVIGENSTILATTDGGDNWIKQVNPIDTLGFTKVQFTTAQTGFIVGEKGLVLTTSNGGETWVKIECGSDYDFQDASFVNDTLGWVCGTRNTNVAGDGIILHTTDGGRTWVKQIERTYPQNVGLTLFIQIEFLNDSVGWAYGGDYFDNFSSTDIYYTNNGGIDWEIIGTSFGTPLYELNIANGDTLWGSRSAFVTSSDGGVNWTFDPSMNVGTTMRAASPIDGLNGWIYSGDFNTNERKILYTQDGGYNWSEELDLGEFSVRAMTNTGGERLWIVGPNGFIMRWQKNITSINISTKPNDYIYLEQNYPNPFNPSTTIRYNIQERGMVLLKVFNIMGEEVVELVNEFKDAGSYSVYFNASEMSSGIYFYQLYTNQFNSTKKMLLLQ